MENAEIPVGFCQTAHRKDLLSTAGTLREAYFHGPAVSLLPEHFELLQLLHTALNLAGLGGLVAEPFDKPFDPLDLGSLQLHLFPEGLAAALLLGEVMRVVSLVKRDLPVRQFGNHGDDLVEEDTVVGDRDDRPGVVLQPALQPFEAFRVEVIGRLVEEHDVRPGEENDGKHDPHLPTAGELRAVLREVALAKSETGEHLLGL